MGRNTTRILDELFELGWLVVGLGGLFAILVAILNTAKIIIGNEGAVLIALSTPMIAASFLVWYVFSDF